MRLSRGRKTAPAAQEPPRRTSRRTTAPAGAESAELTAASGAAATQPLPHVLKVQKYLLNGTPYTTGLHCAVTNADLAVGMFVRKQGPQIQLDFGGGMKWFSAHAADQGSWRVTDAEEAVRLHALWLQYKPTAAAEGHAGGAADADDDTSSVDGLTTPTPTGAGSVERTPAANQPGAPARIRAALPISFPDGTLPPANTKLGLHAFFSNDGVLKALRLWVVATLRGDGLTRHVPAGVLDAAGLNACDSMIVSTPRLVEDLRQALKACVWANGRRAPAEMFGSKRMERHLTAAVSKTRSGKLGALRHAGARRDRAHHRMSTPTSCDVQLQTSSTTSARPLLQSS